MTDLGYWTIRVSYENSNEWSQMENDKADTIFERVSSQMEAIQEVLAGSMRHIDKNLKVEVS